MKRIIILIFITIAALTATAQRSTYADELEEKYMTPLFQRGNATMFVPMDEVQAASFFNVFEYLQGRVAGLSIYYNRFQNPVVRYRMGTPAFFLNEMRVDAASLANINMNDIAVVKFFRPPFAGSFGGANGAIAVYTMQGDEDAEEEPAK